MGSRSGYRHRPAGFPPPVDLRNGGLHVPGGAQDDAGQPVAKGLAVVLHPAVICLIERIFERIFQSRVRLGGPDAEPARWQQQVHVHAFQVHVLDALGGVVFQQRVGGLPVLGGEPGHILAGVGLPCFRFAQPASVFAGVEVVGGVARLVVLPQEPFKLLELTQVPCTHVPFQNVGLGTNMSVRIEYLVAVLCHGSPSCLDSQAVVTYCCSSNRRVACPLFHSGKGPQEAIYFRPADRWYFSRASAEKYFSSSSRCLATSAPPIFNWPVT